MKTIRQASPTSLTVKVKWDAVAAVQLMNCLMSFTCEGFNKLSLTVLVTLSLSKRGFKKIKTP